MDGGTHAIQTFGPGFTDPQGVAVNNKFIFVADAGANEIVKLDRTTGAVLAHSSVNLHGAQGVAVARNGHVWVADTNANTIVHLRANLNLVQRYKPRGNKALEFSRTPWRLVPTATGSSWRTRSITGCCASRSTLHRSPRDQLAGGPEGLALLRSRTQAS